MPTDNHAQAAMPDPTGADAPGRPPFAKPRNRTILGKLALVLSLVPWAAFGLGLVFGPAVVKTLVFYMIIFGTPTASLASLVAVFVDRPKGFAIAALAISGATWCLIVTIVFWFLTHLPTVAP